MKRKYVDTLGLTFTDTVEGDRLTKRIIQDGATKITYQWVLGDEVWLKGTEKVEHNGRSRKVERVDYWPDMPSLPVPIENSDRFNSLIVKGYLPFWSWRTPRLGFVWYPSKALLNEWAEKYGI